jgi:hypothetical protein
LSLASLLSARFSGTAQFGGTEYSGGATGCMTVS